jgi:hypothetical protein
MHKEGKTCEKAEEEEVWEDEKRFTVKPAETRPPIYWKPGQTENKFQNGVISYVK